MVLVYLSSVEGNLVLAWLFHSQSCDLQELHAISYETKESLEKTLCFREFLPVPFVVISTPVEFTGAMTIATLVYLGWIQG